ncbi:MAG: hypothetical protein KC561_16185, partial [Myxococcales bacterium]|nr:hypothetical protein [Myxococcales bacterium]
MPKICPTCERIYPDFVDFCVAGGFRLQRHVPDQTVPGAGHAPGEESETTKDLEPLDASASA